MASSTEISRGYLFYLTNYSMQPILNFIKHPSRLFLGIVKKTHFLYSDSVYLRLYYFFKLGKVLHLHHPLTFNEKLQWLKLYDRRPEYTMMVDKYSVKNYVAEIIGREHTIPTLGVWDSPDDIEWDLLPQQFVLKTTHGGGGCGVIICKNKATFNKDDAIHKLSVSLKSDIYKEFREWPYKNVKKRIIAEQYMTNDGQELEDYKIHCFNGTPKFILLCRDRFSKKGLSEDFYSTEWEHLNMKRPNRDNPGGHNRPKELDEMIRFAKLLSKDIPFIRTDFYIINGQVYFGELTFFPAGGMSSFEPEEYDRTLGSWLVLPHEMS